MITLFPKIRRKIYLYFILCFGIAIAYVMLNPVINPLMLLFTAVLLPALLAFAQLMNAASAHSRMLTVLYNEMNPESFIKAYTPKLELCDAKPNLKLMVCLHLSNAYCVLGDFDKARQMLAAAPKQQKKEEDTLLAAFAVTSNYCYCAQQEGDVASARKYLDELLSLRKKLEKMQEGKPEKKRMVFSSELNELCMDVLEGGKGDVEALKDLAASNSQQLHKVTVSLWVARAQLNHQSRREAQTLLEKIATLAPHLYCGKEAAKLLAALPEKDN